jgi:N-methylhydantoinase B/oxoprolinase/acetone carboxylase alpha subunit
MSEYDNFSEYINYRDVEESPSEHSTAPSTSTSKRTLSTLSADQSNKKLKLNKNEKSFVWRYFTKHENKKVQCKIIVQRDGKEVPCDVTYKFTGSTSNLKYHLNVVHGKTEADEEEIKVNIILLKIIIIE